MIPPSALELTTVPAAAEAASAGAAETRAAWYQHKWLLLGLLLLAFIIPLSAEFHQAGLPMEEGALLATPELALKGSIPYRDFETFSGPANLYVLGGVFELTGPSVLAERCVGLAYRLLALAALFALISDYGTALALGCVCIAGFVSLPLGVTAQAWLGGVACALLALWRLSQCACPRQLLLGGVFAGAALSFRPDLAPAVLVSALPLILLPQARGRVAFLLGGLMGATPLLLMLILAGPRLWMADLFRSPLHEALSQQYGPVVSATGYASLLHLLCLHGVASLLNLLAGIFGVCAHPRDWRARRLLALALFSTALTHQALMRFDFAHVASVAFVSMGILPLSLALLARATAGRKVPAWLPPAGAVAAVCVAAAFLCPALPTYLRMLIASQAGGEHAGSVDLNQNGRTFPLASVGDVVVFGQVLDRLADRARPGERLFVGPADLSHPAPNDAFLYFLMPQLTPATYFLEMNPGSVLRSDSRLAADLGSADWLILDQAAGANPGGQGGAASRARPSAAQQIVQQQFDLLFHQGRVALYRRRATGPMHGGSGKS